MFLNGHAGNSSVIAGMRSKLAAEEGVSCLGYNYWDLPLVLDEMKKVSQTDKGSLGHAGEIETSLQLYLQPELVDMAAASWVSGVWGDPSSGTSEKGVSIIDTAVKALVKTLRDYYSGELENRLVMRKEIP